MLDRTAYRLRRALRSVGPWLGSWQLSVAAMVTGAFYYALLAIWSTSTPSHVVQNIADLTPFLLVYALLLINTGMCLWQRLPRIRRDLGAFLFHGAFFLLAVGVGLTVIGRREASIWVAEGEAFTASPEQILSKSSSPLPHLPSFSVNRLTPEFWRDQLLFTHLEAELTLADGARAVTRINRPLWLGWGNFTRLSGFGYAPRYEIRTDDGRVVDSAFVKMNVFPPGQRDHFRSSLFPHRFYLEVYPDYIDRGRGPETASLNLSAPAVRVEIIRGRVPVASEVVAVGAPISFEGLQLSIPEIRYWGEFSVVSDPGVPVLLLSALLGVVGLIIGLLKSTTKPEVQPERFGIS